MSDTIKVAELFAGVGGFRLGLEGYDNESNPDFYKEPAGNSKLSGQTSGSLLEQQRGNSHGAAMNLALAKAHA